MFSEKITFADNLRLEPTIIFMETILFSLKLFSGHFYGQSFIKTVRGPLYVFTAIIGILMLLQENQFINMESLIISAISGSIQASLSKIKGLLKDSYSFQGLKIMKNTDFRVRILLQKC